MMWLEVAVDHLRMASVARFSCMKMLGRKQRQAQHAQHWQEGYDSTPRATVFCH
jgi:hypothetical protein